MIPKTVWLDRSCF